MGILKKIKRKTPTAQGIDALAAKIGHVNDLIALRLLKLSDTEPNAYIYPEMWAGKDDEYKRNWCQNVFIAWSLLHKKTPEQIRALDFHVFDSDGVALLGRYNDRDGFRA